MHDIINLLGWIDIQTSICGISSRSSNRLREFELWYLFFFSKRKMKYVLQCSLYRYTFLTYRSDLTDYVFSISLILSKKLEGKISRKNIVKYTIYIISTHILMKEKKTFQGTIRYYKRNLRIHLHKNWKENESETLLKNKWDQGRNERIRAKLHMRCL